MFETCKKSMTIYLLTISVYCIFDHVSEKYNNPKKIQTKHRILKHS